MKMDMVWIVYCAFWVGLFNNNTIKDTGSALMGPVQKNYYMYIRL